jgi:hypothetical protein
MNLSMITVRHISLAVVSSLGVLLAGWSGPFETRMIVGRTLQDLPSSGLAQADGAVVISDVPVIPMTGPAILRAQHVVVQNGRIVTIGPTAPTGGPPNSLTIDGRGKYLVPGLIDAHVHVPPDGEDARTFLRLFVANGITSVMNLSGTAGHLRLRQQLAQGAILGPQMFTSGPRSARGTVSPIAPQLARLPKRSSYRSVPAMTSSSYMVISREPAYQALMRTARREGIPVIGHAPRNLGSPPCCESASLLWRMLRSTSMQHYSIVARSAIRCLRRMPRSNDCQPRPRRFRPL